MYGCVTAEIWLFAWRFLVLIAVTVRFCVISVIMLIRMIFIYKFVQLIVARLWKEVSARCKLDSPLRRTDNPSGHLLISQIVSINRLLDFLIERFSQRNFSSKYIKKYMRRNKTKFIIKTFARTKNQIEEILCGISHTFPYGIVTFTIFAYNLYVTLVQFPGTCAIFAYATIDV